MTRHYRPAVMPTSPPGSASTTSETCAALLIAAGAHLEEIKDHLGHASIRIKSDRYGHLYQAARDRLRDHLEHTYAQEATVPLPRDDLADSFS